MRITLIAMNQYDDHLWDYLSLPEGIEKDIVINNILIRSSDFELLYKDVEFMKLQIGYWSRKHQRTFERWINALNEEYNPLHNYDRHEMYSDTKSIQGSNDETIDNQSTAGTTTSGSRTVTLDDESKIVGDVTEKEVSAFNASDYVPSDKTSRNSTSTQDSTTEDNTETSSETEGTSTTTSNATHESEESLTHEAHLYGNIGVTTSQQMLKDELNVALWNIYDNIADLFVDEYCVCVYE